MRWKAILAACAALVTVGFASPEQARADSGREEVPRGWRRSRVINHHVYYPRYVHNYYVDPYAYRDRLQTPKLITLGTNDPYWPLEALELYRGDLPAHRSYLRYLLFVSFFPHLVAGPIVRPRDLLPQLERVPGLVRD